MSTMGDTYVLRNAKTIKYESQYAVLRFTHHSMA